MQDGLTTLKAQTGLALLVLGVASTGCNMVFRSEDPATGIGPRLALDVSVGWQETGAGVDQSGASVYSEGVFLWSHTPFSFGWGMQSGKLFLEPVVLFGSASGAVDNGKLIGIADAQVEEYRGSSAGGGLRMRFGLTGTAVRFGLDVLYSTYSGESDFTVDGLPALTAPYGAVTSQLQLALVLEYDDPSYKPYLSAGVLYHKSEFEDQSSPGNPVTVESRDVTGARLGAVIKSLFGSRLDFDVAVGYYSGPLFTLGVGYRF